MSVKPDLFQTKQKIYINIHYIYEVAISPVRKKYDNKRSK